MRLPRPIGRFSEIRRDPPRQLEKGRARRRSTGASLRHGGVNRRTAAVAEAQRAGRTLIAEVAGGEEEASGGGEEEEESRGGDTSGGTTDAASGGAGKGASKGRR